MNNLFEYDSIKIYNYDDRILFEGEYSNSKINGRGKEYNEKGKLIFEGEYENGKRLTGTENVYDEINGELIFEYEYKNGEKYYLREYDKYNYELLFSGNYLNGKKNGFGEEFRLKRENEKSFFYSSSSKQKPRLIKIFSGEYLNGEKKNGKEYNYGNCQS